MPMVRRVNEMVVELGNRFHHTQPGGLSDNLGFIEDSRDGGAGDAGTLRYFVEIHLEVALPGRSATDLFESAASSRIGGVKLDPPTTNRSNSRPPGWPRPRLMASGRALLPSDTLLKRQLER